MVLNEKTELNKLRALLNLYKELSSLEDFPNTLNKIFKSIEKTLGYKSSLLLVNLETNSLDAYDINSTALSLVSFFKKNKTSILSVPLDYKNKEEIGLAVKCYRENEPILSNSMYDIVKPLINKKTAYFIQKALLIKYGIVLPINVKGKVVAVMTAGSKKPILEEDINLLKGFADIAGLAFHNSELYSNIKFQLTTLKLQNQDLQSLFHLTSNVLKSLDPKEVIRSAVNSIPTKSPIVGAMLSTLNTKTKDLKVRAVSETPLKKKVEAIVGSFYQYQINLDDPNVSNNPTVTAVAENRPVFNNDLSVGISPPVPKSFIKPIQKATNIYSTYDLPIVTRGKIVGIMSYFLDVKNKEDLKDNFLQLLQTYTNQIAIALENATLYTREQVIKQDLKKALQELREARRKEKDMIDVMGHELRTPISIVRNSLILLEKDFVPDQHIEGEKLDKYLKMAIESTKREIRLIETLLSTTKVEGKRIQLHLTKVDLKDAINDALEGNREQLEKKQLELRLDLLEKNYYAYADRTRTQEIVDNFINNAIKYTASGYISIRIYNENDKIAISVKDSGVGIKAEDIPKLGKKFFRARSLYEKNGEGIKAGGTGLGLFVTFTLIKIMGGEYEVNSDYGNGSEFVCKLPVYSGQEDQHIDQTFIK